MAAPWAAAGSPHAARRTSRSIEPSGMNWGESPPPPTASTDKTRGAVRRHTESALRWPTARTAIRAHGNSRASTTTRAFGTAHVRVTPRTRPGRHTSRRLPHRAHHTFAHGSAAIGHHRPRSARPPRERTHLHDVAVAQRGACGHARERALPPAGAVTVAAAATPRMLRHARPLGRKRDSRLSRDDAARQQEWALFRNELGVFW